jgi:acetyl esterase/lipase
MAPGRVRRRAVLGGLVLGGPLVVIGCAGGDEGGVTSPAVPPEAPTSPTPPPRLSEDTVMITYGEGPRRFGHLDLPTGEPPADGWPVAVLIHGGFWRSGPSIDLMFDLARSLTEDGWATWNIQYSGVGDEGGQWPGTFLDVAAAIDHVDEIDEAPLDTTRVLAVGHSAGGHLALWAAGRPNLPTGAPGADPTVPIRAVVSQAGVTDLLACAVDDLGGGACSDLMGGDPDDDLDRYVLASPIERLPLGVPTLLVHGDRDIVVPVTQSRRFITRAREADEDPTLLIIEGADHFAPIDASHVAWQRVRERIPGLIS